MRTEQIQQRIDGMTVDLAQAVQSGSGARFFMLLSMISSNQDLMRPQQLSAAEGDFQLPRAAYVYPDINALYTPELTERMNRAVQEGHSGEFAFVNSYLHTRGMMPRQQWQTSDQSRLNGQLMTAEVEHARQQLVAAA